jgi:hypothetical protein
MKRTHSLYLADYKLIVEIGALAKRNLFPGFLQPDCVFRN